MPKSKPKEINRRKEEIKIKKSTKIKVDIKSSFKENLELISKRLSIDKNLNVFNSKLIKDYLDFSKSIGIRELDAKKILFDSIFDKIKHNSILLDKLHNYFKEFVNKDVLFRLHIINNYLKNKNYKIVEELLLKTFSRFNLRIENSDLIPILQSVNYFHILLSEYKVNELIIKAYTGTINKLNSSLKKLNLSEEYKNKINELNNKILDIFSKNYNELSLEKLKKEVYINEDLYKQGKMTITEYEGFILDTFSIANKLGLNKFAFQILKKLSKNYKNELLITLLNAESGNFELAFKNLNRLKSNPTFKEELYFNIKEILISHVNTKNNFAIERLYKFVNLIFNKYIPIDIEAHFFDAFLNTNNFEYYFVSIKRFKKNMLLESDGLDGLIDECFSSYFKAYDKFKDPAIKNILVKELLNLKEITSNSGNISPYVKNHLKHLQELLQELIELRKAN